MVEEVRRNSQVGRPIRYKIHIPIICIILVLQFFVMDMVAFLYLKIIENRVDRVQPTDLQFFKEGEYIPIYERNPMEKASWRKSLEDLSDYKFVLVREHESKVEEIYYTKNGFKKKLVYDGDRIKSSHRVTDYPGDVFLALPFIGVLLFIYTCIHFRLRTGEWTIIGQLRQPLSNKEKTYIIYAITILFSFIVFSPLKQIQGF